MKKIYDIAKTLQENLLEGPFWDGQMPEAVQQATGDDPQNFKNFLGFPLQFPFGVSACPLTINSKYIQLMSQLGFDLITYKSVRSFEWGGNEFPNWLYADLPKALEPTEQSAPFLRPIVAGSHPVPNQDISMVNSFGVASVPPEEWQADVDRTCEFLGPGQILILSLMLSQRAGEHLQTDAERIAELAVATKAHIFELNLSCPNTEGGKGMIYEDMDLSAQLCKVVRSKLGGRPLLAKIGYYRDPADLKWFMAATKGVIDGITTMNTYSVPVETQEDEAAFPGRPTAGLSGAAIHKLAYAQLESLIKFKHELNMEDLVVVHTGGVTKPEHIKKCLAVGADAVQSTVGAWNDPLLAQKYLNENNLSLEDK